ncbi:peptide chain release factor 1 [candidate division TM6 bacterium RIFCSPHIGHO2_12_FULL_38_8]|nr:MAG: peptide chain release factor 1 [candidate division TM6 bacterium RIFCSPHIGHO2_12_FULL_38_8]
MFTKWDQLETLYKKLEAQILSGDIPSKDRSEIQKNASMISDILSVHQNIVHTKTVLSETQKQAEQEQDHELVALYRQEVIDLQNKIIDLDKELEDLMYPLDDLSSRSAFLEIRAGTGGQEAALFAADLLKMYLLYAQKKHWKANIISQSSTDLGGLKEVIVHIVGKHVYGLLKLESGVHRVQRVPATETAGRVHTSTATVAVLPEAEDVDVQLNDADLRIDVYRSGGAGGQHVNTTDSAVRVTHIPTGVAVACQEERSQHKNKAKALKMLRSRLLAHAQEVQRSKQAQARKEQIGTGERSEKIRTYNYPQNRITDHQVNESWALEFVMQGDLENIIQALQDKSRMDRQLLPVLESL